MQAHMTLQSRSFKTVGRPSRQLRTQALFGSRNASTVPIDKPAGRGKKAQQQEPVDKVKEYKARQGLFGSIVSSLDFAEVRSERDAELLYDAKYGDRSANGGKMTREQYMALRRKVGGTAKDFFKESIDVKGKYAERGYVSSSGGVSSSTPLFAVAGAGTLMVMLAALVLVVQKTS
ncbi:hypothetical protein N2152v2_007380 [Parachlorella kessleri]